jgi:hypothetical protein
MGFFSKIFGSKLPPKVIDETIAIELDAEISTLENCLNLDPSNVKIQQELVTKYSEAASVFAQSLSYCDRVDGVFTRINQLRNTARSNF